jgi:hypothetical protein
MRRRRSRRRRSSSLPPSLPPFPPQRVKLNPIIKNCKLTTGAIEHPLYMYHLKVVCKVFFADRNFCYAR